MFAKKVDRVLVGFNETKKCLKNADNVVVTGTPTKVKKLDISSSRKREILESVGVKNDLPVVLIFGGSQGAQKINEAVYDIIKSKINQKYQIIWATGPKQFDVIKEQFEKDNLQINNLENTKVLPYIYNMDELMNVSDLLVCRSGAMTITEITIVGKPAIFIPLPSKMANRQEDNARVLEKIGAAKIILNENVSKDSLGNKINDIILKSDELEEMGKLALNLAPVEAIEKIYGEIKTVVNKNKT